MSRLYTPVSDRAKTIHGEDDFEAEFSAAEEADQIAGGHLSIVPCAYRVLSDNYEAGGQGEVVDLALSIDREAHLIAGGHIERADEKSAPTKKAAAKKAAAANEKG